MSPLPDRTVLARMRGAPGAGSADRTTAPAPSVNEEHIIRVRGKTIEGELSTSSSVTSVWNWASGLREPWRRALTAAAANCSTVAPRSSMRLTAHVALRAMSTDPEGFSISLWRKARSIFGTPSSMPASVSPRSPVHIFSTPTARTVPAPAKVARVARCSAEDPPPQELSTFTIAALRSPASLRYDWPRRHPWSSRRPAVALPKTTRLICSGSTWASARASFTTVRDSSSAVRSGRFMGVRAVPTMCARWSMVSSLSSQRHAGPGQGGDQALELVDRLVRREIDRHVLCPGPAEEGHDLGDLGGRAAHQMALERFGRDAVQGGHPSGAAAPGRRRIVVDAHEQHHRRGHLAGGATGPVDLLGQAFDGPAVSRRAEEQGHPTVSQRCRPTEGGFRGTSDPHRYGGRRRELAVAGRPCPFGFDVGQALPRGPRPAELDDAGIEQAPTSVVVDAGLFVLARVASHPDAEDHPAPREGVEGGGLLGHHRGLAKGQLHHARPDGGPPGGCGGHGQCHHALEAGSVPKHVVTGPQGAGSEVFCLATDTRQVAVRSRNRARVLRPGRGRALQEGRKDQSDRPQAGVGGLHGHASS